jgi:osmotically-inducible protein OsmY
MKRKNLVLWFAMLLMVVALGACTSLNKVTPEVMDDEAIEVEVRAKMAEDVDLKAFSFEVAVDDCTVTLGGHVDTNEQRTKAAQAAGDVKGVCRVVNNLHVGP